VLATALPSGTVFWNFKLREGMKFSDATASPSGALFWNRMVTCTDSSSRDVLTVLGACVAKRNILALRGSISATKPRTPRPMAYSRRRAPRLAIHALGRDTFAARSAAGKIGGWFVGKIPEFTWHGPNYDEASFGTPYNGSLPMVRQANLLTYDFILGLCIRATCE